MKLPLISVVTPSLNQGRFLEAAIRSVLDQHYPRLEYIVMDGGSSDGSADTIRRYESQLAYWASRPDRGQADAIATGFDRSKGDVLAWLNADDMLLPGSLDRVAAAFASHPGVGVLYGSRIIVDKEGRAIGRYDPPTILSRHYFGLGQWIPQESSFWRREAYAAAGGVDRSMYFCMDFSMYVRMWRHTRFMRYRGTLGALRIHADTKTSRAAAVMIQEAEAVRRENGLLHIRSRSLRRLMELAIYAQGRLECLGGRCE